MERISMVVWNNSIRLIIIDVKDNRAHHQIENLKGRSDCAAPSPGSLTERGMECAIETVSLFVQTLPGAQSEHYSRRCHHCCA